MEEKLLFNKKKCNVAAVADTERNKGLQFYFRKRKVL